MGNRNPFSQVGEKFFGFEVKREREHESQENKNSEALMQLTFDETLNGQDVVIVEPLKLNSYALRIAVNAVDFTHDFDRLVNTGEIQGNFKPGLFLQSTFWRHGKIH